MRARQRTVSSGFRGPRVLRKPLRIGLLVSVLAGGGLPSVGAPEARAQTLGTSEGRLVVGLRGVDVGGETDKYREDVDLGDGPRLMDLDVSLTSDSDLVDRIRIDLDDLGGEPFESISIEARRYGRYDVRYERHESEYFYDDQLFSAGAVSVPNARAGDFRTFDFRRVRDRVDLDLDVGERAGVTLGFDRYRKTGQSTAPLSLQRDLFVLERPIDESSFESSVGFQYAWDGLKLSLEERYTEYENAQELFLPGQSVGASRSDLAVLDFFFLERPYALTSLSHVLRLVATPVDGLTVRASGTLQGLDLDLEAREESGGTGFGGAPFATDLEGGGSLDRSVDLWDLDVTYLIGDRWGLVAGSYLHDLDQDGELVFGGMRSRGRWDMRTRGVEGGVQWASGHGIGLTAGLRRESRDVARSAVEGALIPAAEEESTGHLGYFGTLDWKPLRRLSLTLDWEDSSIDDPFTLASATRRTRLKARGRYTLDGGVWVSASYRRSWQENGNSSWEADHDLGTLRLGYRNERINTHVGYSRIEIDRSYEAEVEGTFGPSALFDVDYRLGSTILDALVRLRAGDSVWFGGQLRHYDNDGSFGLTRRDQRLFAEYHFLGGYLARLSLRYVEYDEAAFDFDDYDAVIADVGIGYTW